MPGGEDFGDRGTGARDRIEQAGMETDGEKDVGRDAKLHLFKTLQHGFGREGE
jgi:hypothetical protein